MHLGLEVCSVKQTLCFTSGLAVLGRNKAATRPNMEPDGPNKPQLGPKMTLYGPTWRNDRFNVAHNIGHLGMEAGFARK